MIQSECQIVEKKQLSENIHLFIFENAVIATKAKPGQFVHVNLGPRSVLRRPFSIYDTSRDTFSVLFQVLGQGTRRLATYRAGQFLDILGPLGHGFPLEGEKPVLVGGGMGVASLNLLYKRLMNEGINSKVIMGFRDSACVIQWPGSKVCTDDGSLGSKGFVTDLLEKELDDGADVIYACGPEPMLKKISSIAKKRGIKAYLCVERFMACGVGACLSCVCETKTGLARVCKEGPVFNSNDLIFDEKRAKKNKSKA